MPAPRAEVSAPPSTVGRPSAEDFRASRRTRSARRVARRATAAGLLLVVTGGGITAAAAGAALPGDPLYGVKRWTESVRLHAAHGASPVADAQFVARRLAEAEGIATPAQRSVGTARWADFDVAVNEAGTMLGRLQTARPSPAAVAVLADQRPRWEALLAVVPPQQRVSVTRVLVLIASVTGTLSGTPGTDAAADGVARGAAGPKLSGTDVVRVRPISPGTPPARSTPSVPTSRSGKSSSGRNSAGSANPGPGSSGGSQGQSGPSSGSHGDPLSPLPLLPQPSALAGHPTTSSSTAGGSEGSGGRSGALEETSKAITRLLSPSSPS